MRNGNLIKKENKSPFADRDLHTILRFPHTLSWSSMSSFGYDKEKWYQAYVLGVRTLPNSQMMGGIEVGERWATDPEYLPEVEKPEIFEQELSTVLSGIKLIGHLDGLSLKKKKKLFELKTSCSDTRWSDKTVRGWGQIDFYCFLLWTNYKIKPEDLEIELIYVPMKEDGNFQVVRTGAPAVIFPTVRTMTDILKFATYIKATHADMVEYCREKGYDI